MTDSLDSSASETGYKAPKLLSRFGGRDGLTRAGMIGLPVVAAAFAAVALWRGGSLGSRQLLGFVLLGVSMSFGVYAAWRELQLRAVRAQLDDERVLSSAYSNRVRDLSALVSTARTINGVLELDEALQVLLDEALGVFQGSQGSIMLLDGAGFLQTVCAVGNERAHSARMKIGESVAGHVALTREPLLLTGRANPERFKQLVERDSPIESAMCVPLLHRNQLLGVLNVNAGERRAFSEHDLQLLTVFAGHAAIAIANARVFEGERDRLAELAELNRVKSELISSISHDLRTPLAALRQSVVGLGRLLGTAEGGSEIVESMTDSLTRLSETVDRLLSEAGAQRDARAAASAFTDLADTARKVTLEYDTGGAGVVEVDAPPTCVVGGDSGLLEQVLWNLLDNAFRFGKAPIRIEVRHDEDHGIVSVIDRGPGIAPGDRERIFDRYSEAGGDRSGMGLGLSIVHGIVSALGGRVWADDAEGGGAVFSVALPLMDHKLKREVGA